MPAREATNPFTRQAFTIPAVPAKKTVFEIEQRGNAVETCTLRPGKRPKYGSTRYASASQAERAVRDAIERKTKAKYVDVGRVQMLAPAPALGSAAGSALLLDELFGHGDPRFLDDVLACTSDKKLTTFAEPWIADARPEMRRALLDYVDDGCDRWFHKGLVKHLFKAAERLQDDELLAHFMVAFDRLSRRYPVDRNRWQNGTWEASVVLMSDPLVRERIDADTRAALRKGGRAQKNDEELARFTRATRRYLARRAFRWFRVIGRADKARYGRAMRIALPLYRDEHLDRPVRLLDSWALLHVLYAWSPVLDRNARGIRVAAKRSLGELTPAPYFPDAWKGQLDALLAMVATAKSRTVRRWAIAWLEATYPTELEGIQVSALRPLLLSLDEDAARFGSKLFERARGLETLAVDDWLALLRTENLDVAPVVAAAFEKNVSPKRLSLAQAVDLTHARIATVAELGLRWAIEKKPSSAADLTTFARVANATVESVRRDGARFILTLIGAHPSRRLELLRDLFDSRFADVRTLAKEYLDAEKAADVPLWFALLESPYDDVRALVVKNAESWQAQAGIGEVEHLALTVLLAVHRGAGAKQSMLRRIADRAAERPDEAERLLPVLSIALRSVRPPERVGALAALARAAVSHDVLRAAVTRFLPELTISGEVVR